MAHEPSILDNPPLHWTYPHLRPRLAYIPDPSTSCWRIELTGLTHLPSPAHPAGQLPSAGSPWPSTAFWLSLSDAERQSRAAHAWRSHELLVERKPVPWTEGEETREERRRRLLCSEGFVEACQEKEAILEAGRGRERGMRGERARRESLARGVEEVEGVRGCVEGGRKGEQSDEDVEGGAAEVGREGVEVQVRALHHAVEAFREADEDVKAGLILPKSTHVKARMTDDGPFIAEVLAAHEDKARSVWAGKYVQLTLDAMATLLMLAGLVGLYAMVGA